MPRVVLFGRRGETADHSSAIPFLAPGPQLPSFGDGDAATHENEKTTHARPSYCGDAVVLCL